MSLGRLVFGTLSVLLAVVITMAVQVVGTLLPALYAPENRDAIRTAWQRANAGEGAECQPTSVYFCPDMCHEVSTAAGGSDQAASSGTTE